MSTTIEDVITGEVIMSTQEKQCTGKCAENKDESRIPDHHKGAYLVWTPGGMTTTGKPISHGIECTGFSRDFCINKASLDAALFPGVPFHVAKDEGILIVHNPVEYIPVE